MREWERERERVWGHVNEIQDRTGDEKGDGNESSSEGWNGDEDGNRDGNEDGIGEGGRGAKKRNVGNGRELCGKMKQRGDKSARSVAADPDNLKNSKESGTATQGTQGLDKNCTSRESVHPLCRA